MSEKTQKKKCPKYKVIVKTAGSEFENSGDNVLEALNKFDLDWHDIKDKGEVVVCSGDKKYSKLFVLPKLRLLFGNKLNKQLWARNLEYLIDKV